MGDDMARTGLLALATIGAIAAALSLSGCTTPSSEQAPAAPSVSAEPTIDPGPVVLTGEDAATRYLSIVCPINVATRSLNEAYAAGEPEYLAGGAPDVSAVVAAAVVIQEGQRLAIEQLDETYFIWPELVAPQIAHVRSTYMANMAVVTAVALSTSFEEAYQVPAAAQTPEEQAAGQEIRYQLGLSADTDSSCVGYENGLSLLSAEKSERDAALAKQDSE